MKKIKFVINGKMYNLYITKNGEYALIHMGYKEHIKRLKNRIRYDIKNNVAMGDYICKYSFISSFLENGNYILKRLNEKDFVFEECN